MLRAVHTGSEVDLDPRAITTEDDIVDLDQLYPPAPPNTTPPAPTTHPGHEPHPPAPAPAQANAREAEPTDSALNHDGDDEFDQWATDTTRRHQIAASDHTRPAGTAQLPRSERKSPTSQTPPVTSPGAPDNKAAPPARPTKPQRGWRALPLPSSTPGRLAAAALTLTLAGGSAIAITTANTPAPATHSHHQSAAVDTYASTTTPHRPTTPLPRAHAASPPPPPRHPRRAPAAAPLLSHPATRPCRRDQRVHTARGAIDRGSRLIPVHGPDA